MSDTVTPFFFPQPIIVVDAVRYAVAFNVNVEVDAINLTASTDWRSKVCYFRPRICQ